VFSALKNMKIRFVLCDIEGTTTSIAFAKDVLFPLAHREMETFIHKHWNSESITNELLAVKQEIVASDPRRKIEDVTPEEVIQILREWILADKKVTPLKSIQGKIWKKSFEEGEIRGHVYPDVRKNFEKWTSAGIRIAIFSSGSVEAQKLLFRYSEAGDLTPFVSAYFDTTIGTKREPSSYRTIANALSAAPEEILFLSDVVEELAAAANAGMVSVQVVRESSSTPVSRSDYPTIVSFDELQI
jgi:enolase-phosphatase E1